MDKQIITQTAREVAQVLLEAASEYELASMGTGNSQFSNSLEIVLERRFQTGNIDADVAEHAFTFTNCTTKVFAYYSALWAAWQEIPELARV